MANIIWTPPEGWEEKSGAHVSFKSPCDCSSAGNLIIGNNAYSIVDACGNVLTGKGGAFVSGAILDVILDCENLKAYLQNSAPADYVVEQGTSGKWTYRKWASGIGECWGIFSTDGITPSTAWGSIVYGTWMNTTVNKTARKYPFAFTEVPNVQVSVNPDSGDCWLISDYGNNYGTLETYAPAYAVARPNSGGINMPRISYYVIGKWK